jgi:hypothetical protein
MLAFDVEASEVVFMKDYWRTDVNGMKKEGEFYTRLESNHVPNIAPFGKGNDVRDHTTLTHPLRDEKWLAGQEKWCSSGTTGCPWTLSLGR